MQGRPRSERPERRGPFEQRHACAGADDGGRGAAAAPEVPLTEITAPLTPAPTQPGDVDASHDPGFLKRFQGSKIIYYEALPFEALSVGAPDPKAPNSLVFGPSEGEITRIMYQIPKGHSVLEVVRNYEQALKSVGFNLTGELGPTSDYPELPQKVFYQSWETHHDDLWTWGKGHIQQVAYMTAKAVGGGKPVTVAVLVSNYNQAENISYASKPTPFDVGQPYVLVDVLTAKPVANQMVTVKAADMADALANKGFVDLYGIYFDTDQSAIKPESAATLSEVASLLKIDRSLKLEVSGHTDSSGNADHNLKLSGSRAEAVVAALVTTYGIDRGRLIAKGYGSTRPVAPNSDAAGMAKNRRVELRKM
jgi:outer membrane protein OmpA-like peptidoglycan-associated protein